MRLSQWCSRKAMGFKVSMFKLHTKLNKCNTFFKGFGQMLVDVRNILKKSLNISSGKDHNIAGKVSYFDHSSQGKR